MTEKEFEFFSKAYEILVRGAEKKYGAVVNGGKVVLVDEEVAEDKAS